MPSVKKSVSKIKDMAELPSSSEKWTLMRYNSKSDAEKMNAGKLQRKIKKGDVIVEKGDSFYFVGKISKKVYGVWEIKKDLDIRAPMTNNLGPPVQTLMDKDAMEAFISGGKKKYEFPKQVERAIFTYNEDKFSKIEQPSDMEEDNDSVNEEHGEEVKQTEPMEEQGEKEKEMEPKTPNQPIRPSDLFTPMDQPTQGGSGQKTASQSAIKRIMADTPLSEQGNQRMEELVMLEEAIQRKAEERRKRIALMEARIAEQAERLGLQDILEEETGTNNRDARRRAWDLSEGEGYVTHRRQRPRESFTPGLSPVPPKETPQVSKEVIQEWFDEFMNAKGSRWELAGESTQPSTRTDENNMDQSYHATIPTQNQANAEASNALRESEKIEASTAQAGEVLRVDQKNYNDQQVQLGVMATDEDPFSGVQDQAVASANESGMMEHIARELVAKSKQEAEQLQETQGTTDTKEILTDSGRSLKTEAEDARGKAIQQWRLVKPEPTDPEEAGKNADVFENDVFYDAQEPTQGPYDHFDSVVNKLANQLQSVVPLQPREKQALLGMLKPFYNKFRQSEMHDVYQSMSKSGTALFNSSFSTLKAKSQIRSDITQREENVGIFMHWLVRQQEFQDSSWPLFGQIVSALGYPTLTKAQIHWILTGKVDPEPDDLPHGAHKMSDITGLTNEDIQYLIDTVELKDNTSFIDYFPNQRIPVDFNKRPAALPQSLPGTTAGPAQDTTNPLHVSNIPDPRFTVRGGQIVKNVKVITVKNPKFDPNLPVGPNNKQFMTKTVPDIAAGAHEVQQAVERAEADRLLRGQQMKLYPSIHPQAVDAYFGSINYQRVSMSQEFYLKFYSNDRFTLENIDEIENWNKEFMLLFGPVINAWAGDKELIRTTPVYDTGSPSMVVYEYMELNELKNELLRYQLVIHPRAERVTDMLVKPDPFDKHLEDAEQKAQTTEQQKQQEKKLYDSNVIMFRLPEDIPATDPTDMPHPGQGTATDDTPDEQPMAALMDTHSDVIVHKNADVSDSQGNKLNVPISAQEMAAGIKNIPATNEEIIQSTAKPSLSTLMFPKDNSSKKRKAVFPVDNDLLERKRAMFSKLNTR